MKKTYINPTVYVVGVDDTVCVPSVSFGDDKEEYSGPMHAKQNFSDECWDDEEDSDYSLGSIDEL